MRLYYDEGGVVRMASDTPVITNMYNCVEVDGPVREDAVGKRVVFGGTPPAGVRLAVVCNWGDSCGIATYTKYLLDALGPRVAALKIFAEDNGRQGDVAGYDVSYNWKRGEPMGRAAREVLDWGPTVVLVQHEFGIFPKASHWLGFLDRLSEVPYAVTLHSVYQHLDKSVCTAAIREAIVHTKEAEACLRAGGFTNGVSVIPHGCVNFGAVRENFNLYQCDYPVVQFGFGFSYKGVEVALEAVARLRSEQPVKYKDIFFTYLCSESPHVRNVNNEYYRRLVARRDELGLQDNVAFVRGFQSDDSLNNYLRTNRLAVFPYQTDPDNVVYGASGAVRVAMANGVPVVASASHMFDDMEGVLPRPKDAIALAKEIDGVFSSEAYRRSVLDAAAAYTAENSWERVADAYLGRLRGLDAAGRKDALYIDLARPVPGT